MDLRFRTIDNDTILPSLTDSAAWLTIDTTCTIIAHFVPPITHQVMLDVDPPGSAAIQLGRRPVHHLPDLGGGTRGIDMPPAGPAGTLSVLPVLGHPEQHHRTCGQHASSGGRGLLSTDTVVAHLEQEIYGYYVPNSSRRTRTASTMYAAAWQRLRCAAVPAPGLRPLGNSFMRPTTRRGMGWSGQWEGCPGRRLCVPGERGGRDRQRGPRIDGHDPAALTPPLRPMFTKAPHPGAFVVVRPPCSKIRRTDRTNPSGPCDLLPANPTDEHGTNDHLYRTGSSLRPSSQARRPTPPRAVSK